MLLQYIVYIAIFSVADIYILANLDIADTFIGGL